MLINLLFFYLFLHFWFLLNFRSGGRFFASRLKLLYLASGVNQIFFSGVKRMAIITDFNLKFWFSGTDGKSLAAGTMNLSLGIILRMDVFFHNRVIIQAAGDYFNRRSAVLDLVTGVDFSSFFE